MKMQGLNVVDNDDLTVWVWVKQMLFQTNASNLDYDGDDVVMVIIMVMMKVTMKVMMKVTMMIWRSCG